MHANLHSATRESPANRTRSATTGPQDPPQPSVDEGRACPTCDRAVKTVDTSESVCPDCLTVVEAHPVSTGPRPRYDETDRSKARTGSRNTALYADRGLGVGVTADVTPGQFEKQWQHTHDHRLAYALGEIRRMSAELYIPRPEQEAAARLYRRAYDEGHIEGRSIDGFTAASLLVAVRQSEATIPVSESEIERVMRARRDQFRTARGVIECHLGETVPPMSPVDFLPRAACTVSAPSTVESCAKILIEAYEADEPSGFCPRTITATALHAACDLVGWDDRPTLAELSDALDVSKSTISQRKTVLLDYREVWEMTDWNQSTDYQKVKSAGKVD